MTMPALSLDQAFQPHPFLRHPHLMTIVPRSRPRRDLLKDASVQPRLFDVSPGTQILAQCHWHPYARQHGTLLLVHGLEGSSESHYMLGTADKAWRAGFNVVRFNQRNCGGTEHLCPTLYHGGLSGDVYAVVTELSSKDGLANIWLAGYSMGGNLVLKMAGEVGRSLPALRAVLAVCPNIDPGTCVSSLQRPSNWIYHRHFLTRLKKRLERKARLFPGKWDLSSLSEIKTMRDFDHWYTGPDGGFASAEEYYAKIGAQRVLGTVEVPTLIITAQDDPFIPYSIFDLPAIRENRWITLSAPKHGGHCGFYQRRSQREDPYWAENRLVEVMRRQACAVEQGRQ